MFYTSALREINYMMNLEQGMAVVRLYKSCIQIRQTVGDTQYKGFYSLGKVLHLLR